MRPRKGTKTGAIFLIIPKPAFIKMRPRKGTKTGVPIKAYKSSYLPFIKMRPRKGTKTMYMFLLTLSSPIYKDETPEGDENILALVALFIAVNSYL